MSNLYFWASFPPVYSIRIQRAILRRDLQCPTFSSLDHKAKANERRAALMKRIKQLRGLQALYSPASIQRQITSDAAEKATSLPTQAEDVVLWFPSQLNPSERDRGCVDGLAAAELALAEGRAYDALHEVCSKINTKAQLVRFRNVGNVVGQNACTKSNMLLQRLDAQLFFEREKYNVSREAVLGLGGVFSLPRLEKDDLRANTVVSSDSHSAHRLNAVTTEGQRAIAVPSKASTVSWIWTARGGAGSDEVALHAGTFLCLMLLRLVTERQT